MFAGYAVKIVKRLKVESRYCCVQLYNYLDVVSGQLGPRSPHTVGATPTQQKTSKRPLPNFVQPAPRPGYSAGNPPKPAHHCADNDPVSRRDTFRFFLSTQ